MILQEFCLTHALAVGPAHLFGRLVCLLDSSTSPIPKIICNGAGFSAPHIPPVLRMAMLLAVSCKKHTGVYHHESKRAGNKSAY